MNFHCTANAKNAIKNALKKERLSVKWRRVLDTQKRNYDDSGKKKQAVEKRYNDKKEFLKHYKKENVVENGEK